MAQAPAIDTLINDPPAISARLQTLRQARKLSPDELSHRAGMSKSMLSQVERSLANPTVTVLWRLVTTLGVGLADSLSPEDAADAAPAVTVIPTRSASVIKNPDGKCKLRILGPVDLAARLEWYELTIQSGGMLVSEPHGLGSKEYIFVSSSTVAVQLSPNEKKVRHGESARYPVDVQHTIPNAGKTTATASLAIEYTRQTLQIDTT